MIFLNSIWLFALAALSIPVAIHLWNIKRGKTLKVGSISLITVSSQKKSRSLKLNDLLLLLLRCLLLALVAFVLAVPLWQRHNSSTVKGWVLIPKRELKETYQKFKPTIDSLNKAGYEFHYFNKGFAKADLTKGLADTTNYKNTNVSYWSLVQQLDGQISSSLPVRLFTSNGIIHFNGVKPQVSLNLHWQTYTPADSTSKWIERAWLTNNGNVQIVRGDSQPEGMYFMSYPLGPNSIKHDTGFVYASKSDSISIIIKNEVNLVALDTTTWRFAIYAEKNSPDAGYVKAALASIVQFTKHKATIKQYADVGQISQHQNWVFWLSVKPVNQQLNCDNLIVYENGKVKNSNSWINDESSSKEKIALYKSVVTTRNNDYSVWKDGFGDPVLSLQKQEQTSTYHFYNRFDPAWNDLVWSDSFPKMMMKLIVGQSSESDMKHDRRVMDAKQVMPIINHEEHVSNKIIERTYLSHYLWLLLVLIFAAERWMTHNKSPKKIVQHG